MKEFEVAILGSGASGCMCALTAGENDKSIALIDKHKTPAKKLMATGNGRCNLSNIHEYNSIRFYNQPLEKYFSKFNFANLYQTFEEMGLMIYSDHEGRAYPISNSAKSVIEVIGNRLAKFPNISIFNEKTIENIEKIGEKFKISLNDEEIIAKKVVFSLGGNCNELLESLGVKCKANNPSLCGLKTEKSLKRLANVRISPVSVTAKTESGKEYSEQGEIMFKENGLSGIVIFNCSCLFAREGNYKGIVTVDLMPSLSYDKLFENLFKRRGIDVKVSNFFDGMFAREIGYYILEKCNINEDRSTLQMTEKEIESLAKTIKSLEFKVIAPLDNNQVYSGGALLEELTSSLEAKALKDLFICGEACDVDGKCGGYNLQWAWTSGYIVGLAL